MTRASRKLEHLKLALETAKEVKSFQDIQFVHHSLPEMSLDKVNMDTIIGGLSLSSPIIINAMTGGAHETEKINQQLAEVAKAANISMAVGSQMSAIKNKDYQSSYRIVRKVNPDGVIIGNIGSEASVEQAKDAVEMIGANLLQIHLNTIQELIMPEGDKDFEGRITNIQRIIEEINIPVIIKEVGFGISQETAKVLKKIGATIIDVGGKGGTNFAKIENSRRTDPLNFLNEWGLSTPMSVLEVKNVGGIEIIASGGIQNSLEVAKAIALGASGVGIAGRILKEITNNGPDGALKYIEELHFGLKLIMTALGSSNLLQLKNRSMVITNDLKDWCELRGINIQKLATRK